jgi:DNA mismatch endonuclease (patch repair protein)
MGRIRCRDTAPERMVRSLLHKMGFRFRLHQSKLPGNPDVVLPKWGAVVFVNGCFWHRHEGCRRGQSVPTTRPEFWKTKFEGNKERDRVVRNELQALGWKVIVVWECEIKPQNVSVLEARLRREIGTLG